MRANFLHCAEELVVLLRCAHGDAKGVVRIPRSCQMAHDDPGVLRPLRRSTIAHAGGLHAVGKGEKKRLATSS